jgi:hypothetical protein
VRSPAVRACLAALCAAGLSGCIDSADPILTDPTPIFGQKLTLQFFSLRNGFAHEPERATFTWNGALYAHSRGGMQEVAAFSVQSFEAGDDIIQEVPAKNAAITEYALLHKLAEGVYQVIPIDEADADEQTRAAYCKQVDKSGCRITTREQLLAFARATQARRGDGGGLAIRLPDDAEAPGKHRQRHRK